VIRRTSPRSGNTTCSTRSSASPIARTRISQ
jgi:hypothetical protein